MREIKFRAWDTYENKMEYSDNVRIFEYNMLCEHHIMQFTGLKDKNGREIYEGDILCWPVYEGGPLQTRWVVEWDEKRACFIEWIPKDSAEIIGNIYENPELLENK